jgi:hypothetical protein
MEKLYDYVFWYNHHEKLWYAIPRDQQLDFFNGNRSKVEFLKSKKESTLIEIICKSVKIEEDEV